MEKEFRWGQVQRGDLEVVCSVANSKTFPLSTFFPSPESILLCKSLKGFLQKDPSHLQWKGVTSQVNFFQLGVYKLETAWILQAKWPAWGKCPGNTADSLALIRTLVLDWRLNIQYPASELLKGLYWLTLGLQLWPLLSWPISGLSHFAGRVDIFL